MEPNREKTALERQLGAAGWRMNSPRASQPRTCVSLRPSWSIGLAIWTMVCALALVQNKAVSPMGTAAKAGG
jgi:hypothetical protein